MQRSSKVLLALALCLSFITGLLHTDWADRALAQGSPGIARGAVAATDQFDVGYPCTVQCYTTAADIKTFTNSGTVLLSQGTPTAATVSATLTAAQVLTGIITVNQGGAGASAQQLPAASAMDTALPAAAAGQAFDFSVINISTTAAESASLTTNTGWTLVGDMDIQANSAATTKSAGRFRAAKTGAGAWILYRLS